MTTAWSGTGNIQISSNGVQNIKSDGYVTKKYLGYGCIDKNTLFKFGVVQGPLPNLGDKVSYEAQRTTAASCWNATKVKVIQFSQTVNKPETNAPASQYSSLYQQQYQTAKPSSQRYGMYNQQQTYNQQHSTHRSFGGDQQVNKGYNAVAPSKGYNAVAPPPMAQIVGQPTSNFSLSQQMSNKRSRFDAAPPGSRFDAAPPGLQEQRQSRVNMYQERFGKPRRSRTPPRKPRSYSRSRSRSPRRKRSPRPRYSVKVAKFNLLRPSMDTLQMQSHYPSLYIPSDVGLVFRHALFQKGDTIPFTDIVRYHVMDQGQNAAVPAGSKTYRSKVLLLNTISKTKLYSTTLNDKREHFTKLLRFWCNYSDKEITAFGGTWSAELDGADPDNPQTLINTAIRNVKAQLGLDLSYCRTWYKIAEVHYHRVNDKKNTEEHIERTSMYLPSTWDCQPSQEDWDVLKQRVFKSASSSSAPASSTPEAADVVNKQDVVVDVVCAEMSEDNLEAEFTPDQTVDYEVEDDVAVEISSVLVDIPCTLSSETDVQINSELLTDGDIKNMKVTELRSELEERGLSTKGLKIQLIARLQKALKDEAEGPTTAVKTEPEQSTETPGTVQHWKLQPDIQKKMNKLMARLNIDDKQIVELPDLAAVVLHPAKGVEVADYSLASLLDYNKSDKKERVFEVSLFSEIFNEMFQRHFAVLILKALIEADGEEDAEEEKTPKRQRQNTEESEHGERGKEGDDKKDQTTEEKKDKYVHRPDLLLAFLYFDKNRAGYLAEDDILSIIHSIGLNISRSQIKVILDKVLMGKSKLNYRSLCERASTGSTNVIQQETVNLKEIEEVLLLGTDNRGSVVKVDVIDAPDTEKGTTPHLSGSGQADVVVVGGSYVVRSELPELLSKAMKKVAALENKVKDVERQNDKLEKRIEESKNVKHSYNDLEQEVVVRQKELEILSQEKIRSELNARKFKNALDMAKTSLTGVIAQISSCVEEAAIKEEKK